MRIVEATLIAAAVAVWLRALVSVPRAPVLATMLIALSLLQFAIEGWRRPLLPLYVAVLITAFSLFWPVLRSGWAGFSALSVSGALLGIAALAVLLLPAPVWPTLTGPFQVGVRTLALAEPPVTTALPDAQALAQPPPRIQIWYPTKTPPANWTEPAFWRDRASRITRPYAASPAVDEAPLVTDGMFPVVTYFPGWPGTGVENTALIRELVSHGYVVVSLAYPARLPGMSEAYWQALVRELERPLYFGDEAQYRTLVAVSIGRVHHRANDAVRALDRLQADATGKPDSPFYQRLDWHRVAAVGFSLGGATAAQAALQDPRYQAVVNMDGRHWAEAREMGVRQPYLMLSEILALPTSKDLNSSNIDWRYNSIEDLDDYTQLNKNLRRNGGLHVTVRPAAHMNFTDLALRSPWPRLTEGGHINGRRGLMIQRAYVLAFLDRWLNGRDSPLLHADTPSPFPEVTVEDYGPPKNPAAP